MQKPESQEAGQVSEGCHTSCRIVISQESYGPPKSRTHTLSLFPWENHWSLEVAKATSGSGATSSGCRMLLMVSPWKHRMRLCIQGSSVLPLPGGGLPPLHGETESSKEER